MSILRDASSAQNRPFRAWFPPVFLVVMGLGALGIGLNQLFIPSAAQFDTVAAFAGREYAVEQLANFDRNPFLVKAHAAVGSLFVLIAAFQFWRDFRNRNRRIHGWMGYAGMACLLVLPVTGIAAAFVYPFAGIPGVIPNVLWGAIVFWGVWSAWRAIRRRDVFTHEAWLSRATGVTFGITLARGYTPLLVQGLHVEPRLALAIVFWMGAATTLAVAELWVRRPGGPVARAALRAAAA